MSEESVAEWETLVPWHQVPKAFDDELFEKLAPIRITFKAAKAEIEKLPTGRMRSIALTDLESAFTRACFAAADMADPIEDG